MTVVDGKTAMKRGLDWAEDARRVSPGARVCGAEETQTTVRTTKPRESRAAESRAAESRAAESAESESPSTGRPTITGTARVGGALPASVDGIADADADGLENATFACRWLANDGAGGAEDTAIEGATTATCTRAASDVGKTLKVRVAFTGGARSMTGREQPPGSSFGLSLGGDGDRAGAAETPR